MLRFAIPFLLLASTAGAQPTQGPDTGRLLTAVEQQRNMALTFHAQAEAQAAALADEVKALRQELEAAKARIAAQETKECR